MHYPITFYGSEEDLINLLQYWINKTIVQQCNSTVKHVLYSC
jgi:hypothetical protein